MNSKVRMLGFSLTMLLILCVAGWGIKSVMYSEPPREVKGYVAWDKEVVEEMRSLAVHDGGRVKPFQTLARRYMYAMHGDRSMKILVNGQKLKITPTEWMMDIIFRPEVADQLPTFRVDNSEILEQLGLEVKSLRDRYAFDQLRALLSKLQQSFEEIRKQIERAGEDSLSKPQEQMYALTRLLQKYHALKNPFILSDEERKSSRFLDFETFFYTNSEEYIMGQLQQAGNDKIKVIAILDGKIVSDAILKASINDLGEFSSIVLNPTKGSKEWSSIGERFAKIAKPRYEAYKVYAKLVAELQEKFGKPTAENSNDFFAAYFPIFQSYTTAVNQYKYPENLKSELIALDKLQIALSSDESSAHLKAIQSFKAIYENDIDFGDVGGSIKGEILLNKMSYFNNGIAFLLLAGVLLIAMCLCIGTKASRILYWCVFSLVTFACLFTIAGIIHRSWIMDRSPIGTLYDTMPFIVGAGLLLLIFIELLHKKAVMLGVSICFGVFILFLAKSYEVSDARDQMDPLRAVLKSNFWLSTHVVMITLGYMGGIVAACISHFYIIGRAFGVVTTKESRVYLSKIVYGMVAFTLLFSLIGTILGGIWGAESWGRFWGWDPKENGALMIVIWMLVILHARLGGYIKEAGLHVCSVFGFPVIVFSWWHVNFLGVGLHNYGFTSADAMQAIWTFYIMEFLIMLVGIVVGCLALEKKRTDKLKKKLEKAGNLEKAEV